MWVVRRYGVADIRVSVVLVAACACGLTVAAKDQVFRLGGVRNVIATVSVSGETYRIAVEMLAVKAFDPATNQALNRAKGQIYAAQALGRYLKADVLTIQGASIQNSQTTGDAFHAVVVISRANASVSKGDGQGFAPSHRTSDTAVRPGRRPRQAARPGEAGVTVDTSIADFLNRKADYGDTIFQLRETLADEGHALADQPLGADEFYRAIVSLEERADRAFRALDAQISGDLLLLAVEQRELRSGLNQASVDLVDELKSAVTRYERRQANTKAGRNE